MSKLAVVVPKSVPEARKALAAMERDVDAAKTYEAIRKIERKAAALEALFREYEEVKQDAQRVILIARHRIGEELRRAPINRGGGDQRSDHRIPKGSSGPPTIAEQIGSKNRGLNLKKLADIGREQLLSAASTLWEAGKDATQTAVVKLTRALADKPAEFQESVTTKLKEGVALTEALRQAHKELLPSKIAALPVGQYRVIYADPPWAYNDARMTGDHRQSTGAPAQGERTDKLPHHDEEVPNALIPNDEDRRSFRLLAQARGRLKPEEWRKSRRSLVSLVRQRLGLTPEAPALPEGKFACIVADPPWRYENPPMHACGLRA